MCNWDDQCQTLPKGLLNPKNYKDQMYLALLIYSEWSYNSPENRNVHFLRRCYYTDPDANRWIYYGTGRVCIWVDFVSRADTPRWLRFFCLWLLFLPLSPSTFEFHAIVVLEGCRLRTRFTSLSGEIMRRSVCSRYKTTGHNYDIDFDFSACFLKTRVSIHRVAGNLLHAGNI